ncbi:beta-defensin 1-like [Eptesicus fuscus]|uniref:beta-defensin 1-like n=1 Tax=Eptesicus fuscus TaxID=29078 RepID=UPI002404160B|nr:beta-defensin 1-like [Eptesicus fuscus]
MNKWFQLWLEGKHPGRHIGLWKPVAPPASLLLLLPSPSLAASMRLFHILLLPLCLLFAQVGPDAYLLASLIPKSPECDSLGGTCYLSHCPERTQEDGSCYRAKGRCCV